MHLRDKNSAPPGNFRYTQPESDLTITGITLHQLLQRVAIHRVNNGYEPVAKGFVSLQDEVEADICAQLEPRDRIAWCDGGPAIPRTVGWDTVKRFVESVISWWKNDKLQMVPQEEAERRAAICAKCPYNVPMSGCGICQQTLSLLRSQVFKASTSQDAGLQSCGVCGCDNKLQVHVPIEALHQDHDELPYPSDWCWKARDGVNAASV